MESKKINITWVARKFLDYRIPVHEELNELCQGGLSVIYYSDVVEERIQRREREILGDRAIGLSGEWRLSGDKLYKDDRANKSLRLPFQPGLVKTILKTAPDVMFADAFFQWSLAPLWLRFLRRIPYVMGYERTAYIERNAQWYRRASRKAVLPWIDEICCSGSLCRDYLCNTFKYPEDRIFSGQMVADTESLAAERAKIDENERGRLRGELGIGDELVFLYVGRLISLKGVDELLNGWKLFCKKDIAAKLLLVGSGDLHEKLQKRCADEKIDNVIFAGAIDYSKIAGYYALADCFVIATLGDNWSLVVPEAMSCGLPVLCSCYNGCHPELVTAENGKVFDPYKPEEVAGALGFMWQNRTNLPAMGQASKRLVADHSPRHAAEVIFTACQAAIARHKRK